jgi:hypothetical protein
MNTVKVMFEQACDVRRGNLPSSTMSLICHAPFEETVQLDQVQKGIVGHLVKDVATGMPAIRLGLPATGNAVPMFVVPEGKDFDTAGGAFPGSMQLYSHPDNEYQKGTYALLSTGAFELFSTAYDVDATYEPNTPLTAADAGPKLGLLTVGDYYKNIICGVVSRGLMIVPFVSNKNPVTNPGAKHGLMFWTHFQPRLDKATVEAITA